MVLNLKTESVAVVQRMNNLMSCWGFESHHAVAEQLQEEITRLLPAYQVAREVIGL